MTRVSIRETYDLSTMKERMGIIAVKTPEMSLIAKQWGGLLQNHRHIKLVGMNLKMACASMLPADPLQVGTESGEIAPQDMFNPILYRTVTNDSFGTILNRVYGLNQFNGEENSLFYDADALPNQITPNANWGEDAWKIYYSLLADERGWAKAMPQAGLRMDHVVPLVHEVASTIGNPEGYTVTWTKDGEGLKSRVENEQTIRGPARALPPIPTLRMTNTNNSIIDGTDTENFSKSAMVPTDIPNVYCAMIVLPPAKLNILYFRVIVEWVIDLIGLRSLNEIKSLAQLRDDGNAWYNSNYVFNNAKTMANKMGAKDIGAIELIGADGTKVM